MSQQRGNVRHENSMKSNLKRKQSTAYEEFAIGFQLRFVEVKISQYVSVLAFLSQYE